MGLHSPLSFPFPCGFKDTQSRKLSFKSPFHPPAGQEFAWLPRGSQIKRKVLKGILCCLSACNLGSILASGVGRMLSVAWLEGGGVIRHRSADSVT